MKTINSLRSKLFALTLAIVASVASFAYDEMPPDFKVDGLYYNFLEGDNVEVTHPYRPALPTESASNAATQDSPDDYANLTELTIPSTVTYEGNVYHVTRIGHHAFDQCENLTSVDIPNSIKSIGIRAFSWCSALTSMVLKGGLENIESYAFEYCLGLENISLPNSLMTIGQNAFYNTQWYKNQPNGGVYVGNVFYKYKGDIPQNTSFVIKEGTVSISPYAFVKENYHEDYSLVSVSIPNSVKVIGEGVFYRCRALTSIVIPAGVTTIETLAFDYCKALKSVTCEAVIPPALSGSVFLFTPIADATLYVPAESIEAYKTATEWKDFGQILPIKPTSYKSQWCDTWNVMFSNGSVYPPSNTPYRYQLAKDTVIGERTYTAVVQKEINDALDAPRYVAAVRFTDDRKVYIYYDNAEYLLYDFNVQEGDELEVFAGINNYRFGIKTYKCIVTGVEQYACIGCPATITLHVPNHPDDFTEIYRRTQWQEGVGDVYSGFLNGVNGYVPVDGGGSVHLLCAYKGDELKYTGMFHENYGCGDDAEQTPEDLFPTLWGLQQTICSGYYGEEGDEWASGLTGPSQEITMMDGKPYLQWGSWYLREENDKILVYSEIQKKDLVLYDFTLELGDTLTTLNLVTPEFLEYEGIVGIVDYPLSDYDYTYPIDTLVVTELSKETLLDGKEYTRWKFSDGTVYVEGIGSMSETFFHHIADHLPVPVSYLGSYLVCVSKNGKLLYQMDDEEMERLGAECLCDVETSYKDQWCNKWNVMFFDGMRFDETASTSQYRLGKDTIIGDYIYSKFIPGTFVRFTDDRKVYVYHEGFDDHDPYSVDLPTGEYLAYDFSAKVGDTLEVFSGIGTYSTYPCVVYDVETAPSPCVVDDVQADLKTFPLIIKLHPLCDVDGEGNMEISSEEITWIEGVGSPDGFLISSLPCGWVGGGTYALLCAYKGDELKYTGSLYDEYGCEYNANDPHLPLVDWCNQWNILSHGYQGPQDPLVAARTSIFWLSNNTVNRDGQEYIPLMCSSSKPDVESTNLIGELRFTEDKQVYFYYDNTEYLLYDFDVQVGDTLDIFGGIELYSYSFVEQKTYPHVITKIDTLDDGRLQITSDAIVIFEDGEVGTFEEKQQQIWIEGLGSINGIVHTGINPGIGGNPAIVMLCAYRDDECVYKTDSNDPYWIDYTQLGCVYNAGDFIEGAFPILSGLQRTVCNEYCGETEDDNSANNTYKQTFDKIFFENDKPYILCNDYLLREEDNKILLYSQSLNKDIVLYDFTLEVGDSLPAYIKDFDGTMYSDDILVVTDISSVTLLDGKEYKKWTFNNGMEYVEGIGMYGGRRNGNFFGLIQEIVVPCHTGTHLVCVSKNGKLLYQMDEAEMERLGAECLCDYDRGPRKDNAKDGQIGGRPTPTQWNQLELDLREMENGTTILRAETFSYTLEDISQQVNNKTYFQLARQSTKDTATTKSVVGALHFGKDEDNRVYFLRDGVEYVLYDFTAEIGDTVEIFAGINNYPQETTYTHVVVDKDTTEDGACRMFLEVVFPEDTTTAINAEKVWLAGLGSIDGIVHNTATRTSNAHATPARSAHSSETQTSVMLCAWREDSCLYITDHPDYNDIGCIYNQDPTSIEDTHSPSPIADYQKLLRDGQLLIIHKGKTYNVLGVQIK